MKKIIIALFALVISFTSFADVIKEGNTFKVEKTSTQDEKTKFTWEDKEGKQYPIYKTKKGAYYILRISKKTEKEYKYYLPKEVQEQINKDQ